MGGLVDFVDGAAWTVKFRDLFHHTEHGIVAVLLPFGECTINRYGSAEVGRVVFQFAADVEEEQVVP